MRFAVLGPLEVSLERSPLSLGGRKQRTLLAVMLLHANEVVSRDQLIDAMWGERLPPSAAESLDAYVYRLRKLLGHDRLPRERGGCRLRVGPGELDVDEFELLVARARRSAQAGDHRAAVDSLTEALALWRGRRGPTCSRCRWLVRRPSASRSCGSARWNPGPKPSSRQAVGRSSSPSSSSSCPSIPYENGCSRV